MKQLFTSFAVAAAFFVNAQTVSPDPSFGNGGEFISTWQHNGESVINSKIQPDGKIIFTGGGGGYQNFVGRLNADGTLDTSFGSGGYYTDTQVADGDYTDILFDGTNTIIYYRESGTFIKLNANGQLDTTFGSNGTLVLSIGTSNSIVINGSIYVVDGFQLKKISLQGVVLSSTTIATSNTNNTSLDLYVGPNNQILIRNWNDTTLQSFLTLYSTDGSKNAAFGTNGTITLDSYPSYDDFEKSYDDFIVDANGNIYNANSNESTFVSKIRKYDINGNIVTSFGTNGSYIINNSSLTSIKLFGDNVYVTGGEILNGNGNTIITSVTSNGQPNASFSPTGTFVFNTNATGEYAQSLNIISATSIITAGLSLGSPANIIVDKFLVSPSLGTTDLIKKNGIVFENPVRSVLNYQSGEKVSKVELYSMDGKLVRSITANGASVADLPKGTYVAKVLYQNGNSTTTKLIKQ